MPTLLIISLLLFLSYAALILYYRRGWMALTGNWQQATDGRQKTKDNRQQTTDHRPQTRITVIVPARNEEQNIQACLDTICRQSYPRQLFEVIVVDDHSTDNTAMLVDGYAGRNIKRIALQDHVDGPLNAYKKKAIETAIRQSTGELIVTTDADCLAPVNWLLTIAEFYEAYRPAFIAAPVSVNCGNRFIEIFQCLDFMTLQGITGASVFKKFHAMCNGANLAYEKKAFMEVNGFEGIDDIASGDDMLLMHKIFERHPERVMFLGSKEAIVGTAPVRTIAQFFAQRIRWASKADKYGDKSLLPVLLLVYLFNFVMLIIPVVGVFNNVQCSMFNVQCSIMGVWLWLLLFKILAELFFLFPVAGFFGKQRLLWWFPVMQPFHIVYTVIAGFLGKFGTYEWKDRKVK